MFENEGIRLRLPQNGEAGKPFYEVLGKRCGQKQRFDRMAAFIQEWDHLRDMDQRPGEPTIERFAEFWSTPLPTAFRMRAEFRGLFPPEADPGRLVTLLWNGMPNMGDRERPKWLLAVEVVNLQEEGEFAPAALPAA